MNTRQLELLGNTLSAQFQGVFAVDQIPDKPRCLIYNVDPSYLPGSHWQAYFLNSAGQLEHFCSYGLNFGKLPRAKSVIAEPVQRFGSSTCGVFALYYLFKRTRNLKLDFSKSRQTNELKVSNWLNSFF